VKSFTKLNMVTTIMTMVNRNALRACGRVDINAWLYEIAMINKLLAEDEYTALEGTVHSNERTTLMLQMAAAACWICLVLQHTVHHKPSYNKAYMKNLLH
jgi:hypothetical protein